MVSESFAQIPGVEHAFLTRMLPGSTHIYTTLDAAKANIAEPATVIERNLDVASQNFGFSAQNISMLLQTHSIRVATVDGRMKRPTHDADAQVTNVPGVALGVLTADCVPVLFADAKHGVIGATHSGWKGTCDGVLEATVSHMVALGAKATDISAVIGPCIRWDSYEVGPEFPALFAARMPASEQFFKPSTRPEHYLFNLPGVVHQKLRDCGIEQIHDIGTDTYTNAGTCFSHRRQTHQKIGFQGNLLSVIMLK
jgi:YfiH family protein